MTTSLGSILPPPAPKHNRAKHRRLGRPLAVAEMLDMPLSSLYDRTKRGLMPGTIRIGRRIMYDLDMIDAWLDAGGDQAGTEE